MLDEVAHRDEIQREGFRLYITVTGPEAPNTFTLAPGILLIPHADGVWGWK